MAGEAVLRALRHVWLTLDSLNVPAAVVGGIAMALLVCEDLIVNKLLAGWIIDRAAAATARISQSVTLYVH